MKTLIVVSGGDAPGINAAIAHFTSLANVNGDTVVGSVGGLQGALEGRVVPIKPVLIGPWMAQAGSYLQSSRKPVLSDPDAQQQLSKLLQNHQIDNILLMGGDGTQRHLAPILCDWGIPCISIPTTIDNDVPGTERTIGFDSACNFAHHSIDGLMATAHSLTGRIYTVETLGGRTGFIALAVAFAAGAHAVLIPEYPFDKDWLMQRLKQVVKRDDYALVVLAEGIADSRSIAQDIADWTGVYTRDTRLGHGQRGATPTHQDRLLAAQMAHIAYRALHAGVTAGMTAVRDGRATLHEGTIAGYAAPLPDRTIYNMINGLTDSNA